MPRTLKWIRTRVRTEQALHPDHSTICTIQSIKKGSYIYDLNQTPVNRNTGTYIPNVPLLYFAVSRDSVCHCLVCKNALSMPIVHIALFVLASITPVRKMMSVMTVDYDPSDFSYILQACCLLPTATYALDFFMTVLIGPFLTQL